ncbi:EAL domain-containing protein [Massilia sp. S19_KUP03_FR1]|uniref:EAL domain-containing protein n=1 Tax=Massilia sp. S19_KUP03_FR1 TaxID=3025503 RepID=UPI002FCDBA16
MPVRVQQWLASLLRISAIYLIPVGIGLVSLWALLYWHDQYQFNDNFPLTIHVLPEDAASSTPASALARLQAQPAVKGFHTHLGGAPFWFSFDTVHRVGGPEVIEFPSRHAVDIACWDTNGMTLLGTGTRESFRAVPYQPMLSAKAGFALRLPFLPARLLCRASFAGPGYLSVAQWPAEQFSLSIDRFHRKSGLLDGGMIVLALVLVIIAIIQRQALYVVFAGWMILNLRIGALTAGWDTQWLGQLVPSPWLMGSRAIVVVLFGISTLTLYQMLLGAYMVNLRQRLPLRMVQWMIPPTLLAAVVLPYNLFVPVLWVMIVIGVGLLTFDLVRIVFVARTPVALYFAASLAVAFASGIAGIVAGALDLPQFDGVIDSVNAALASSLLAALAVAERMRSVIARRMADQAVLGETWDASPAGLFTLDPDGRFLNANPALWAMLGNPARASAHPSWQQTFSEESWLRLHALLHAQQHVEMDVEQRAELASGRRFVVRATLAQNRIAGVLDNITEVRREIAQLRTMAHHDPLTGVFNRRGIEDAFDAACAALTAGRPLAMAFLSLDRFKLVNDLYGHAAGDEVLKQVAERMTASLAGGEHVGRLGGDAFLVIMPDTTTASATMMCRTVVERIGSLPYLVGEKAFTVHASLGLIAVAAGMTMADAIVSADRACRTARNEAGSGLVAHAREAEAKLVARLSGPKATEGLFLDMQPIMAVAAPYASLDVEVQLSMHAPDGGIAGTGPVIAAAEKSGRAGVIDRWVLGTTFEWLERHAGCLPAMRFVLMRVSGASLNDEHFVQDLMIMLRRHVQVADRLCLAIAERVVLQDLENIRQFIDQVRVFGVKIALDDFGAFHTSFSYLKALPVDLLRIDSSFIATINAHPANAAIVEAMVHLARNLGMKTIACAARDDATVRTLVQLGVDYVQGDAVARAQTLDAILTAPSSGSFMTGALTQLPAPDSVRA